MDTAGGDPFSARSSGELIEQLPKVWIGYVLALATFGGEAVAVTRHPQLMQSHGFVVPPLEIYLPVFVGVVYWLVCVHRYHVILRAANAGGYPVSPAKAVWFHFIPLYNFAWVFLWPRPLAEFVNQRLGRPEMKGWVIGAGILISAVCRLLVDASVGLAILFLTCTYISAHLRRVFSQPAAQAR